MASVAFDFGTFTARYPEFSTLDPGLAGLYFSEATLYLNNSDCSVVTDLGQRTLLLYMVTAHIAALNRPADASGANASSPLVGRIASASEGTVSVSVDFPTDGGDAQAWWNQTKYGAAYWRATSQFRRMRYIPGRSHSVPPFRRAPWQR